MFLSKPWNGLKFNPITELFNHLTIMLFMQREQTIKIKTLKKNEPRKKENQYNLKAQKYK